MNKETSNELDREKLDKSIEQKEMSNSRNTYEKRNK